MTLETWLAAMVFVPSAAIVSLVFWLDATGWTQANNSKTDDARDAFAVELDAPC